MDSLPTASTPRDADDAEVGSQEGTHQEERAPEVSQDNLPDFAPDSAQPEAPDNLLEALNGASIEEEHRTVMSAVIQKVQLAKSGLTEACSSLLTGFEVRILIYVK